MICCSAAIAVIDSNSDDKAIEFQNVEVLPNSVVLVAVQTWHNYGEDVLRRFESVAGLEEVIATISNITQYSAVSHFLKHLYLNAPKEKIPFNLYDNILKRSASISRWSYDLVNLLGSHKSNSSETASDDEIYFDGIKFEATAKAISKLIHDDIDEIIYRLMALVKQMVLYEYVSYINTMSCTIKKLEESQLPFKEAKMTCIKTILPMVKVLVTVGNIFEQAYSPEAIEHYRTKYGYLYMLHQFDMAYNFGIVAYGFDLLIKCLLDSQGITNAAELNNSLDLSQSLQDWSQLVNGHVHVLTQLKTEFIDLIESGGDKDQKKRMQWKEKLNSYNVIQIVLSKALVLILENYPTPNHPDLAAKLVVLKKDLKAPSNAKTNEDKAKWVHEHRGSFYLFYAGLEKF